jgi:uncharacterized protein (TIGR03437 family)
MATFAGNGTDGYAGDGGAAIAAEIGGAAGLAVDTKGNVYFADQWNQRVRVVSGAGVVTTVAGNGVVGNAGDGAAALAANLSWPAGIAVDTAGDLYISSGARVRKVTPDGIIAAFAGGTSAGYAGDGGPAVNAQLNEPHGLAVDSAGNVYIADSGNFRIRKVSPDGVIATVAGNGTAGDAGDGGAATAARIGYVHGLALDGAGDLYFTDPYNHCVREVLATGVIATVAGGGFGSAGDGESAPQTQLRFPYGIVVDSEGNVYVADLLNQSVRIIGTDGTTFTAAGTRVAGFGGDGLSGPYATLNMPAELALDAGGDVYIADLRNFRIRQLSAPQAPPPPAVDAVTNAASMLAPVAPGSIVAITGRNLARGAATATAFPLPGSLGGATVNVNGAAAPVMAASSAEIEFQMPAANAGSGSVDVLRDSLDSGAAAVQIAASAPGLFTLPENQGAILNQDYGVNDPGLPAQPGSEVMLWATGQGATAPAVAPGAAAPAFPLAITPQPPLVTIGGIPAQVLFSGLAPGYAGLWQINALVPSNAPPGDDLPVLVTLGAASSNTVTMAVGN